MNSVEPDLSALSTAELIRHAVNEAKLLARAEVLHAKQELKEELRAVKKSAIFAGIAASAAFMAAILLLVGLALALPLALPLGPLALGGFMLLVAAVAAFVAYRGIPRKALPRTQERLKQDYLMARGGLA